MNDYRQKMKDLLPNQIIMSPEQYDELTKPVFQRVLEKYLKKVRTNYDH